MSGRSEIVSLPASPRRGSSTLMTFAPCHASASVQDGPASNWVRSTTVSPDSGASLMTALLERFDRPGALEWRPEPFGESITPILAARHGGLRWRSGSGPAPRSNALSPFRGTRIAARSCAGPSVATRPGRARGTGRPVKTAHRRPHGRTTVQITNVTVEAYDLGRDFRWGGRRSMDVEAVMLTLEGDEGQQGTALAWTAELPVRAAVAAIEEAAAPLLAGADPLDRPRILAPLWRAFRVGLPLPVIGIVDVALWDLAARDEDLSIADLLGRRRDRIRGCASAPPVDTPEDCEAMVDELLDAGFRAIKLHVCGDLDTDIAVCRAARRAAGDDVDLMMDAMALYDRHSARTLGFVLDDLDFRWFRGPAVGRGPRRLEGAPAPARDPHRGGRLGAVHGPGLRPAGRDRGVRHRAHGRGAERHHGAACARRPCRIARAPVRGAQLRLRPRTGREPPGRALRFQRRLLRASGPGRGP